MQEKFSVNKEKVVGQLENDISKHEEKRKVELQKVVSKAAQELDKVEKAKARKQSIGDANNVEVPPQGNHIPLWALSHPHHMWTNIIAVPW